MKVGRTERRKGRRGRKADNREGKSGGYDCVKDGKNEITRKME